MKKVLIFVLCFVLAVGVSPAFAQWPGKKQPNEKALENANDNARFKRDALEADKKKLEQEAAQAKKQAEKEAEKAQKEAERKRQQAAKEAEKAKKDAAKVAEKAKKDANKAGKGLKKSFEGFGK